MKDLRDLKDFDDTRCTQYILSGEDALARAAEAEWDEEDPEEDAMIEKMLQEIPDPLLPFSCRNVQKII